ncbi:MULTISPECIES: D-glycerate dehydrogenase [unclassified Pseudodesulfovibrio]|uniref:2-hydroxyacid dehydrogenase n=1 Tax=unclassified Pseudodesulfovibrio TaxID=2661612 RepID=UPI000FEBEDDD|nr:MULTISPECIES: D-glycerate dehydrogenase [unclassified Pseudodesulfovibrio]MCJ2164468.1 D-glycerate dehydrogenase [Pseudodesulfovibrio sp. S3-i]RWU04669.1 D-glycerate dehydrogenase [Pseudodesulfovibrio sp. S3]
MDRFKIYITRRIPQAGIDLLRRVADVEINPVDAPLPRKQLLEKAAGCDGVMGLLTDRIDAEFFDAATNLKGYANYAVGFDNIDVPEATRRGLPVSNTPGVLTNATAECAWALIFSVARRVTETDRIMRSGSWTGWGPMQFIGGDISGKTLGIVGAGRIGTATALMSRGFGMNVLYTSSSNRKNGVLESEMNAKLVSFDQLLTKSDFISIHTPLTPQTRHLFDASAFSRMKKTAYLVNTARGPIIKEDDLVAALRAGEIAGAGLDVFENEPAMAPGLAQLDNVVVLPHIGSATASSRTDMATLAARNLIAMLKGQKPETCLNPEIYG